MQPIKETEEPDSSSLSLRSCRSSLTMDSSLDVQNSFDAWSQEDYLGDSHSSINLRHSSKVDFNDGGSQSRIWFSPTTSRMDLGKSDESENNLRINSQYRDYDLISTENKGTFSQVELEERRISSSENSTVESKKTIGLTAYTETQIGDQSQQWDNWDLETSRSDLIEGLQKRTARSLCSESSADLKQGTNILPCIKSDAVQNCSNQLINNETNRSGQFAAAAPAAAMAKGRHLLKWNDMPPHLQFNPYIHTGYRPMLTFWQSLQSLTYFHNETINIITHGIPIVYILVVVPRAIPWEKIESHFLAWCHFAGSISPWIGSFLYHLFMNWNLSSKFYYRLLQLDMLGIWVTQSFGALPMVSASIHCLHPILQWFSMACYTAFSIFGLYKAMTASSPWNRRLCFTLPFLMRNLLCLLRLTRWGGGDPTAMSTVILQDLVSVIGGAIGAMNIPERWFPGSLDYYLNSHNIMHILVVLAVYFMHLSTMKDLVWMAHGSCPGEAPKTVIPDL